MTPTNAKVKGVDGQCTRISGKCRINLPLQSNNGEVDLVSNLPAVFIPSCPYNLLPPQVLIRHMKSRGFEVEYFKHDDKVYIFKYRKPTSTNSKPKWREITIPIGANQLFTLRTNSGFKHFMTRAASYLSEFKLFAGAGHIIEDDDSDTESPMDSIPPPSSYLLPPLQPLKRGQTREHDSHQCSTIDKTREHDVQPCSIPHNDTDFAPIKSVPVSEEFTPPPLTAMGPEDKNIAEYRAKQFRLLTIHESLGHLRFPILQLLAKCGLISRDLHNIKPHTCPGCAYGRQHRKPTRHKGRKNKRKIIPSTFAGHCVSVDQLVSPTPGFVPIHRGLPTLKRYIGATIFVDHFSDFTYCHLMTEMNAKSTVAAKEAFERISESHGVKVRHYHCDNGLFDTIKFKASLQKAHQSITFCGVNAHHQNGKAERRIKDVTEGARTSLNHAAHRWPKAIHPALWPMALKHYVNLRNNIPSTYIAGAKIGRKQMSDEYINSPTSKFSGIETKINFKHFHPFGCPVYVLENKLQASQSHNKWTDRSKVAIFLQHSPMHSSSVPLVLNTKTGNVTPQFHCLYDDEFATCKRDAKFNSVWQVKAKLFDYVPIKAPPPTEPPPTPKKYTLNQKNSITPRHR